MATTPQPGTAMTMELGRVSPTDTGHVGVKAANLASLLRAGFPVPAGVVITAAAYMHFTGGEGTDGSTRKPAAAAALPIDMEAVHREVMTVLGDTPVAVRSSGVAEDLLGASFAGQYETILNVEGRDELEKAVRRCWTSAASAHATAYRDAHMLPAGSMAVLVQRMVNAEAAGVAFSANPVSGRRQEVIVNAVPGLGDKLVSGRLSPDQWVVRGDEARCDASQHDAIDAEQARAIAELARRVEAHFGGPQDIEWAIADGRLHLLQARPISSLPDPVEEPIPVEVEVPAGFWFIDSSHGNSHVPIDRFFVELVRPCSRQWAEEFGYLFDGIEFRMIGGWPYQRMVPLGDRQGPSLPNWLMRGLVRVVPALRRRVGRAIEAYRSDLPRRLIERWYDEWQPEIAREIALLRDVELAELSDDDLLGHVRDARELMAKGLLIHMRLHGAMAPILRELVRACEDLLGWEMSRAMDLVSGTSYRSTEPARRLRDLADMAANRPAIQQLLDNPGRDALATLAEVDAEFADTFSRYLHEYGCRALGHTTLGEATLAETPALVLHMIAGQLRTGYDPQRDLEDGVRKREGSMREAETVLAGRPADLHRLRRVVARAQRAYPVREDNEFFCFSSPLALMRYAVLEVGRRLVDRGVIDNRDDVLYLELDEARAALTGGANRRDLIRRRRGEQAWIDANPGPPSYGTPPPGPPSFAFLPPDARPLMEAMMWSNEVIMAVEARGERADWQGPVINGMAASSGTYSGPVRVVMDETEFDRIEPGCVLVCPATSPVWSVVFPLIGALVTDAGGLLSHPAIIAREYRIPAVVGTITATTRLGDGDVVTVDGSRGTVSINDGRLAVHGPAGPASRRTGGE